MLDWQTLIQAEQQKPYLRSCLDTIKQKRDSGQVIYPPESFVFSAFDSTPFDKVKVVILGQDPYHGAEQAHGLSFSVQPGVKIPPSLRNIYKELEQDIQGFCTPSHGYLQSWAEQGVLLLNAVLTVREAEPNSHQKMGWETFTDTVIKTLSSERKGLVFLLWGSYAQKKAELIDANKHHILTTAHPSPLSARRGFFGCRHFSHANELLNANGVTPIDWHLPLMV